MRKLLAAATAFSLLALSLPIAASAQVANPPTAKTEPAKPETKTTPKPAASMVEATKHHAKRHHRRHFVKRHRLHHRVAHNMHRKHLASKHQRHARQYRTHHKHLVRNS